MRNLRSTFYIVLAVLASGFILTAYLLSIAAERNGDSIFPTSSSPVVSTTTTTATTTTILPTTTTTTPSPTTTTQVTKPEVRAASVDVWDIIAQCESDGRWNLDSQYDGGLQFHPNTWTSYVASGKPYALAGYPQYAYQATREQQIVVAVRVRDGVKGSSDPYLNAQGYGAWPRCRHAAGV